MSKDASEGADERRPGKHAGGRSRGRELALWQLCHVDAHGLDMSGPQVQRALELFWREQPVFAGDDEFLVGIADELAEIIADPEARRWSQRLIDAYLAAAADFDGAIEAASERWRLERMDRVDRNVLRIAAVELANYSTPRGVVVAEAVRLAARYGSERSAAFVNGLAEALARQLRDRSREQGTGSGEQ